MSKNREGLAVIPRSIGRLRSIIQSQPFTFIVNGVSIESDVFNAVFISPAVHEALIHDSTISSFIISNDQINPSSLRLLHQLLSVGVVTVQHHDRNQLILLCHILGNFELIEFFLTVISFESSNDDIDIHLSEFLKKERGNRHILASSFYKYSIDDLVLLDVITLDNILSSNELRIRNEDWLIECIIGLGANYFSLLRHVRFEFLSQKGVLLFLEKVQYSEITSDIWSAITVRLCGHFDHRIFQKRLRPVPILDSVIITDFPSIFDDFRGHPWKLLYRGSRDGFEVGRFHGTCDGHSGTITLIRCTNGNIFGGYTPIAWESRNLPDNKDGHWKCDETLTSFIFTLKSPHNMAPRKFPLIPEHKQYAIACFHNLGPCFGSGGAIVVCDQSNRNENNYTYKFGRRTYINTTGLDGETFFTGAKQFKAQEIEVFEVGI
jgi:hypothetical protein